MLSDVADIELDMSDMFKYKIVLKRSDGSVEAMIPCEPSKAQDLFRDILKKWQEAKDEVKTISN